MANPHRQIGRRRLAIIDYGMGNLASVRNAAKFLGYEARVTDDARTLRDADCYVLPGVGAFAVAMSNLRQLGLDSALKEEVVEKRKPLLGICLGMQLLARDSLEMGLHEGLSWIDAHVVPLREAPGTRVPHVGWSELHQPRDTLFEGLEAGASFYFDHSYRFDCAPHLAIAQCMHGSSFVAAVRQDNIFATQFHPEKSQRSGLKLLRNFLNYCESAAPAGAANSIEYAS